MTLANLTKHLKLIPIAIIGLIIWLGVEAAEIESFKWKFSKHFINYTTWPQLNTQPYHFCIIGITPEDIPVHNTIKSKKGEFIIKRYTELPDKQAASSCKVISFMESMTVGEISYYLETFKNNSILTISSHESFNKIGGHIQFVLIEKKLRFKVNTQSLTEANLSIHPALLRLSVSDEE